MKGYSSFCPIAKAAEILAECWTVLVLRDILLGSRHFNDLRRGVPQMSPTLLSKRVQTLEDVVSLIGGAVLMARSGNTGRPRRVRNCDRSLSQSDIGGSAGCAAG